MDSIYESSKCDDSYDRSISTNNLEDIRDENYVHPDINARDAIFKIRDRIRQAQIEWKVSKLSENRMVKGLHHFKNGVDE